MEFFSILPPSLSLIKPPVFFIIQMESAFGPARRGLDPYLTVARKPFTVMLPLGSFLSRFRKILPLPFSLRNCALRRVTFHSFDGASLGDSEDF